MVLPLKRNPVTFRTQILRDLTRDTHREGNKLELCRERSKFGIDIRIIESHSGYTGRSFNSFDHHQNPLRT